MKRNIYLTELEEKALSLLAKGISQPVVRRECNIPKTRMDIFTSNLRRKTGIKSQKDDQQCQEYLRRYSAAMENPTTNPKHIEVMRRFMERETLEGMAYQLKLSPEDTTALLNEACEAVGIFSKDDKARRLQIRTFLSIRHSRNGKEPTELEMQLLRYMAIGGKPLHFAYEQRQRPRHIILLAREVCTRLGFNVEGRGVQRRMIQDYLARLDAQEPAPVTMDDPMF